MFQSKYTQYKSTSGQHSLQKDAIASTRLLESLDSSKSDPQYDFRMSEFTESLPSKENDGSPRAYVPQNIFSIILHGTLRSSRIGYLITPVKQEARQVQSILQVLFYFTICELLILPVQISLTLKTHDLRGCSLLLIPTLGSSESLEWESNESALP